MSVFELTYGASLNFSPDDVRYEKVIGLITEMRMFALTGKSARRAGSSKASFKDRGMILQDMDIMIAAICLENKGTLVTHNKKHFERIKGLKVEDWVD